MSRVPVLLSVVAAVLALSGCVDSLEGSATAQRETPAGTACEEVRLGIGAFNRGELDETVAHFEEAVPLARAQDDGSARAQELVEAVEYYAALPAEDYLEAAATSPEFAKYKIITLGQCGDGESPDGPSPGEGDDGPGQPV